MLNKKNNTEHEMATDRINSGPCSDFHHHISTKYIRREKHLHTDSGQTQQVSHDTVVSK